MKIIFKLNFANINKSNDNSESMIPSFISTNNFSKYFQMLNILGTWRKLRHVSSCVKSCRKVIDFLTKNNNLSRMYH